MIFYWRDDCGRGSVYFVRTQKKITACTVLAGIQDSWDGSLNSKQQVPNYITEEEEKS